MDTEVILVIAASIFVLGLLSFLFNFVLKYQRKTVAHENEKILMQLKLEEALVQSRIEVQEATYSALGKELHDNIGQLLSTAKMLLGITERGIAEPPATLLSANETIGKAISELRSLSKSLNKEWLEQFDLIQNLHTEVERINAAKVIRMEMTHEGKINLVPEKQIILFRILQEAIQNAIKHSGADLIKIDLMIKNELILCLITDNGQGLAVGFNSQGTGMVNMTYRTKLLGGNIAWQNNNPGCSVILSL